MLDVRVRGFTTGVARATRKCLERLSDRRWPVVVTILCSTTGMAFSLFWGPVVRHYSYWVTPADLWATFRSAHYVGWGYLGGVYSASTSLVTFPGVLLLLAPVAMLAGMLGMTEAFPRFLPHPTAWLLLGPAEMLLSCVALFATDALAQRLGVSKVRRALLCLAQGVILWNVSVLWGHPEDALAMGLAVYSVVFALDRRWTACGWLFGAAIATQPLVVLMLPLLLGIAGRGNAKGLVLRSSLPVIGLMATPLIAQLHPTLHAIFEQPNYPRIDHATPWTTFAPVLGGTGKNIAVAGGPGRLVAFALACALGVWARRWRERPDLIVWGAALAMALRCFTESVMDSFYIWPALALALVVVAKAEWWRFLTVSALAVLVTVISEWRLGELPWWSLVCGGLLVVLSIAKQPVLSSPRPEMPILDDDGFNRLRIEARSAQLAGAVR